ncbi:hypothetical protein EDC04DRAFT_2637105 [Pisolithus marmoratus]|nr:hypothetical protein EDC04DRAFT_2637105 [Pisolithus marmoratus]
MFPCMSSSTLVHIWSALSPSCPCLPCGIARTIAHLFHCHIPCFCRKLYLTGSFGWWSYVVSASAVVGVLRLLFTPSLKFQAFSASLSALTSPPPIFWQVH